MKKPWAISIVTLTLFLICNVAGATDKKSPAPHKIHADAKKIVKSDASAMNYSKAANPFIGSSHNAIPPGKRGGTTGAMDKAHVRDRDHGHKIVYGDTRHSNPYRNKYPENRVHFKGDVRNHKVFNLNSRLMQKIVNTRHNRFDRHEKYGRGDRHGHHHEPGYCTPNFEIFCQRECGDVSPTSCGGHKGFGKHCTPGKMRKCIKCGFIPAP
jgi:hypothetical protein